METDEGVPNLDAMTDAELAEFATSHRDGAGAHRLFPNPTPGVVNAVASLATYARWALTARRQRSAGRIADALRWEASCEAIYSNLPGWARW